MSEKVHKNSANPKRGRRNWCTTLEETKTKKILEYLKTHIHNSHQKKNDLRDHG